MCSSDLKDFKNRLCFHVWSVNITKLCLKENKWRFGYIVYATNSLRTMCVSVTITRILIEGDEPGFWLRGPKCEKKKSMQFSKVLTNYHGININFLKFCLIIILKSVSTIFWNWDVKIFRDWYMDISGRQCCITSIEFQII